MNNVGATTEWPMATIDSSPYHAENLSQKKFDKGDENISQLFELRRWRETNAHDEM